MWLLVYIKFMVCVVFCYLNGGYRRSAHSVLVVGTKGGTGGLLWQGVAHSPPAVHPRVHLLTHAKPQVSLA